MPGIFSFMRNIIDDSREILLLADTHGYTGTGFESSTTSQCHLHLPEVWAPTQHLIDVGLRPGLAQRLSCTYMHFAARYRETCQSHFDRATHGRSYLTEYYREVFTVLFKRTIQASSSQIVSIVRVHLCQAGAPQLIAGPERMDIRVDDAAKAEIFARLGLKATRTTSDRVATIPSTDVSSRMEEVSEQAHALSTDTAKSHLNLSELSPISPVEVTSGPLDPFCQLVPSTCFPAPYPPPPEHSSSYSPQRALATSFVPSVPPRNVRSLTSYTPDVSSLIDLFGRMAVTSHKTDSTNPKHNRMPGISELNNINPSPSPIIANFPKVPQLASAESIASPRKSPTTVRRRKIAALPTRRGKTSTSPTPPSPTLFDSAGATPYPTPRPYAQIVQETSTPQTTPLVSTLPSHYTAVTPCFATPKYSVPKQRRVHTLRKAIPQSQTISQNRTLNPRTTAGATFSYNISQSPPLLSDTTSYFDSPPTSSDELDTPPSTPPSSHVLLASTSTESLAISSEPDRIVSHKEPRSDAKPPYPSQRYSPLDFMKGGLCRDEQPLTFTFSVKYPHDRRFSPLPGGYLRVE